MRTQPASYRNHQQKLLYSSPPYYHSLFFVAGPSPANAPSRCTPQSRSMMESSVFSRYTTPRIDPFRNSGYMKRVPHPHAINLQERLVKLTAKRQEILRPVLEQPRGFVLLSVRDMAKRLNTDPATIVRIVRVLGFANFREFQKHLHDLSIAFATSADTMQAAGPGRDGHLSYLGDSLDRDLRNLQTLKNTLDGGRLVELAKRIYASRRII